jgi:predicted nucleotidyltransferase
MASTIEILSAKGLIKPPSDVKSNTYYETVVGSVAYGVADSLSDYDVNGFYIPCADLLFPHLGGHLMGFDEDPRCPKAYQQHHVFDEDAGECGKGREYDLNIYTITQYFRLCMDNNPNMVDTLYTPRECVLHSTAVSEMVRENRDLFLHKQCWPKYKGYAYQQLKKMKDKKPEVGSKRWKIREMYGYDVKFAYHLVRLLYEVEMIMNEHMIDIQRHRHHLKAIRRGEIKENDIMAWAASKEKTLELAYANSTLRMEPEREKIKSLLITCLEHHYGSMSALQTAKMASGHDQVALRAIRSILNGVLR